MTGFLFASVSAGHGVLLGLVAAVCLTVAVHVLASSLERGVEVFSGERDCSDWACTRPGRRRWDGSRRCSEHAGTGVAS